MSFSFFVNQGGGQDDRFCFTKRYTEPAATADLTFKQQLFFSVEAADFKGTGRTDAGAARAESTLFAGWQSIHTEG